MADNTETMQNTADSEAPDYASMTADELFERGKHNFKILKDYAEAAECFSRCVEIRSANNPYDNALRECYLWYADSLLTKEEENQSMFASAVDTGTDGSLPSAETVLENAGQKEASDETLAFEMFQIAFHCYKDFLESQTSKGPEMEKEVLDASYCCVRLGDMFFTNNQFPEAATEYQRAVELRRQYHVPERHLASIYVSLAQCQMFSGQLGLALRTFTESKEIMMRLLMGNMTDEEQQRMKDTVEDVDIQIADLKKLIESVSTKTDNQGSQCNAADLVPQTTGTFDQKKLDENAKSAVINIAENNTGTKRRIDISGMYK
ncbi:TPR repeat family protein [Babesia bovis T2Bo]|uniref:Tetratricopeptide SHNi-TPR domain-containing protein n=1 Tax=Babesia bovis TaxID=5865 RepID=A7AVH2_BABBO|nr:TPR repeat family protein [Babesia bovis T2Bo]EDO05798.1 TPR repeat family protein [Babesia bovis T2Bo]|eukprot:XP_001609366.1 hypothetical protein [Babesia bovis T2Bo]